MKFNKSFIFLVPSCILLVIASSCSSKSATESKGQSEPEPEFVEKAEETKDQDLEYLLERVSNRQNIQDLKNTPQFKNCLKKYLCSDELLFVERYLKLPNLSTFVQAENDEGQKFDGLAYISISDKDCQSSLSFELMRDYGVSFSFYLFGSKQGIEGYILTGPWQVKYYEDEFGQQGEKYVERSVGERDSYRIGIRMNLSEGISFWGLAPNDYDKELILDGKTCLKIKYQGKIRTFSGRVRNRRFFPENMSSLTSLLAEIEINKTNSEYEDPAYISLICESRDNDYYRKYTVDARDINIFGGYGQLYDGSKLDILRLMEEGYSVAEAIVMCIKEENELKSWSENYD